MKRNSPTPVVHDHPLPTPAVRTPDTCKPLPVTQRLAPTLLGKHRRVSYVSGEKPKKQSSEACRLHIQGLGGSIKMDLSGVGIRLSKAAFLHWVTDDSLSAVGIYHGDTVVIEPAVRRLHAGNLLLVEADGRAVLLRLRKDQRLWMLEPVDGTPCEPMLLHDYGIQGVALGVIRLFNELRPQKDEWNDATCETGFEIPLPKARKSKPASLKKRHSAACQPISGRQAEKLFPLSPPTDGRAKFRLNDTDKEKAYKAWPDKR